jgi:PTH1 family peptidyl-tRNA hydrolase
MQTAIKAIIGLSNSDKKYQNTYHNIGAIGVNFLAENYLTESNLLLFIPPGFMNQSGIYVKDFLVKNNLSPNEVIIIHDDSDLLIGAYKLSFDSGSAGHNGINSIISNLKTNQFWRLRIGIRNPKEKIRKKAQDFVLKKISLFQRKTFSKVFSTAFESEISKMISS